MGKREQQMPKTNFIYFSFAKGRLPVIGFSFVVAAMGKHNGKRGKLAGFRNSTLTKTEVKTEI